MLVIQKGLCGELQNVSVCTIMLSFHFPRGAREKCRELTEKMSVHAQ